MEADAKQATIMTRNKVFNLCFIPTLIVCAKFRIKFRFRLNKCIVCDIFVLFFDSGSQIASDAA